MPLNHVSSPADDRIPVAAHRLAIYFTEDADLPARYRSISDPSRRPRKVNEGTEVEKRFKANVES